MSVIVKPEWQAKIKGLRQELARHGSVRLRSTGAIVELGDDGFCVRWPKHGRTRHADSIHTALMLANGPEPEPSKPNIVPSGDGSKFGECPF